ncbi:hypothetical protein AMQ84_04900 [Paenibacillus riograndensis]|uniref:Uncharacterized protein n=1 Tax=Paenibacillus riograndensis TaxID=483937 RepID=A0A132U9P5_9BACL|nr:hypothetical protein AMQ84_04900 [Paenibacillus riograndensis]
MADYRIYQKQVKLFDGKELYLFFYIVWEIIQCKKYGYLGSLTGYKRCRRMGLHPGTEADRGALILPKILFIQQLRTQEPLYRSMEPGIKGKGTNKGISVRCPAE